MLGKKYKNYQLFVIVSTILIILYSIYIDNENGYFFMFLIPLTYLICFCFAKQFNKLSSNYNGMFILNILMYIKYSLSIFIIDFFKDYYSKSFYVISPNESLVKEAIVYILIEIVSIFIIIFFFGKKIYGSFDNEKNDEKQNNKVVEKYSVRIFLILFLGI